MSNKNSLNHKLIFEIRIFGRLDQSWMDWFDGFQITYQGNETLLRGAVIDQAALFGLLTKLNNLGLSLISVRKTEETDIIQ